MSIKQFHANIAIGPLYVCTCLHQTWFRKSDSILKNTNIPAQSRRLYCTNFTSVNNEEWVCHTCLSTLRDSKSPKLSIANGMKWPDKPPELNLHQLEERLIALRIQEQDKSNSALEKDIVETNDYDSDHYSEIEANDHVRNVDTIVDDANIENKYDQVFTFAPGEGQHPLSLYQDKDAQYLCFPSIHILWSETT